MSRRPQDARRRAMDVIISGRNITLTDRFKTYATEKLEKVGALADRAQRIEVKVSPQVPNRGAAGETKVELTIVGPGPVIRAEWSAADKFAAFDVAIEKLAERVRRARDKRKISKGRRTPKSMGEHSRTGFADVAVQPASPESLGTGSIAVVQEDVDPYDVPDYSPMVIRRKDFSASRMTLDEALSSMELVGHDFYLFVDAETDKPSVVYRRQGWDYGVIALTIEN